MIILDLDLTCVRYEVWVVAPAVHSILLQQSAVLIPRPHELGLLSAGLGAPGSEDETNQNDHQDQNRDDGEENPHQRGHLQCLRLVLFNATAYRISVLSHCFQENYVETFIFCFRVSSQSSIVFCWNCIHN